MPLSLDQQRALAIMSTHDHDCNASSLRNGLKGGPLVLMEWFYALFCFNTMIAKGTYHYLYCPVDSIDAQFQKLIFCLAKIVKCLSSLSSEHSSLLITFHHRVHLTESQLGGLTQLNEERRGQKK